MARIDRAKIRAALLRASRFDRTGDREPEFDALPLGVDLRVNPWMPEGFIGLLDGHGDLLGILDVRGDHDPSLVLKR